ncbi:MAG: alpha/beta hydrolase [Pseudomonadota bacterium]
MQTNAKTDLEVIESGYRFVSDDSAFLDCLNAWSRKIADIEAQAPKQSVDEDRFTKSYVAGLRGILEKLNKPIETNALEEAVMEVDAAAMVLTPKGVVVTANPEAIDRFQAVQGRSNSLEWLEQTARSDFETVRTNAASGKRQQHAIVRTVGDKRSAGIAEVYTLPSESEKQHFVVVRSLETRWSQTVDLTLENTFDLTTAERKVARALYEMRDTTLVAEARKTSAQTIRTQIKTILRKTETVSQVDLVRLLGLLNARAGHTRRSTPRTWRDPWGNYRILSRTDGKRTAYTWTGKRNGTPALIVHGCVQGYLLGDYVEGALHDAGIQLFAILRPGFGDSDCHPNESFQHQQVDAIDGLMEELKLDAIPAIGLGNGSVPLFHLAASRPKLFSRLLVTGLLQPYSDTSLQNLTTVQKGLAKLLQHAPQTSETLSRVCSRFITLHGVDWYLQKGWGDVPEVQDTLSDLDILPLIRNACELTLTADSWAYVQEMLTKFGLDPALIERVTCPMLHLHGEYDRSVNVSETREIQSRCTNFTSESIPDAGYFLPYEQPQIFADRLIRTILG